jgi:succinate dehydrogenase/fumarate reductase flavoprotein subunit
MKRYSCDVLVIGGGLAGCWASIRAQQLGANVILVDKGKVGYSGCSTFAAGDILWWTPKDDLYSWLNNYARWGGYLLDPEWFKRLCYDIYERVLEMSEWGAPFERDSRGNLVRKPGRGHNAAVVFPGFELMKFMRRKIEQAGTNILDRIMVTELLVEDGRVLGAAGFNVRNGEFYLIEAKAVVLSTGGCSWKGNYFGQDMVCGEGYALAYRNGAKLMNMEYSNCYNSTYRYFDIYGLSRFQRLGGKFTNALGERFMSKYDPELGDGAFLHTIAIAMAKEVMEGRGPIYFDLTEMSEEDRSLSRKLLPMLFEMFDQAGVDPFKERLEWIPGFQGSIGTGSGLMLTDEFCSTNIKGLYAAGDAACEGLVIGGINGPGAINLSWAIVTGYRSGEGGARLAKSIEFKKPEDALINDCQKSTFRFLLKDGEISPQEVYYQLQESVIGWDKSIIRHRDRLNESLNRIKIVEEELIPKIRASDFHQLMRCHEVEATLITTEMVLRSALLREESRAAHFREDYPKTDNLNWLKWIVVEKNKDGMKFETIDIPKKNYEKYGIKLPL